MGRARKERWRRAAEAAGLDDVGESAGKITGRKGRLQVRLEAATSPDGGASGTRVVVSGLRREPGARLGLGARKPRIPGLSGGDPREIDIGDPYFDRAVSVRGSPSLARAVLDADTRRAVSALVRGFVALPGGPPQRLEGALEEGGLCVVVPEALPRRARGGGRQGLRGAPTGPEDRLPDVLRLALDLAARLEDPPDLALRIANNTRPEPHPRVRRLNVRMLSLEFPGHPATRGALLAAREDTDAEVRLAAGTALGEEGREVLLRLAMGEGASDRIAARAVKALGGGLGVEDVRRLLQRALRARRTTPARACLGALGARGGAAAIETLAEVLAAEKGELATAAADALARTGDPSAEKPLLAALSGGSAAARVAAARALGRVGTAAAVGPLLEAESRGGGTRAVARRAVAEIQLRLAEAGGAAPGQLSLAGDETGRLSLASDEPGRLSLACHPEGRHLASPRHPEGAAPPSPEGPAIQADPPRRGRRSPVGGQ